MSGQRLHRRKAIRRRRRASQRLDEDRASGLATVSAARARSATPEGRQVLRLQRLAGNAAVTRFVSPGLIQRKPPDLRRGAVTGLARADALAKVQEAYFGQLLKSKNDASTRKHYQKLLKTYQEFPSTRVAPIRSLNARVLASRSFMPVGQLEALKRADTVTVLGTKGWWCRVRSASGKEGWLHQNHIFPRVLVWKWLKGGTTRGGTTQEETPAMTGRG